ncbi:MAG: LacI family DNA-binding transcriptional regulator [Verrucomicrobiota bacterium]
MERIRCQKAIAEELGLSQSAVSLALRDMPGVAEKTRKRVKKMAEELGYVPDPMLTSLADYRKNQRPATFRSVIPWLHSDEHLEGHVKDSPWGLLMEGAAARCERLGYRLEPMWLGAEGMTPKRFAKILYSRGINGVVIAPHSSSDEWIDYAVDAPFSSVAVGTYRLHEFPIDHVNADHYQNARQLAANVERLGYRRVGVFMSRRLDALLIKQYGSLFTRLQEEHQRSAEWSLQLFDEDATAETFMEWVKRWEPDALILANWFHYEQRWARLPASFRKEYGHLGIALLCVPERGHESGLTFSGIHEDLLDVGGSAVDLLASLIPRQALGKRQRPRRLLVEGQWVAGNTMPSKPT